MGTERGQVLLEARNTINGERQDQYGNPEDCFTMIATYWNTYLDSKESPVITASDVAMMQVLLKIARQANAHKHDNLVDICGYTALLDDMNEQANG